MDLFLAAVVLRGEQTDAADAKELTQSILDGRRGNLLSSDIDDVSDASLQRDAPIRSDDGQIAGVKEAVLEECSRRRFVMEIAGWPACCAYPHPPGLARRHGAIGFIYDLDHAAWYELVPAIVLRIIQGGEGDDTGLGRSDVIEETRGNAGLGLFGLHSGYSSASNSDLQRIVARERIPGRGQNVVEFSGVEYRMCNSGNPTTLGTVRALARCRLPRPRSRRWPSTCKRARSKA